MNKWLVIGSIAGVGTLAILLLKGGGGGTTGTTAAGTSINAALGSIQEQNLNLMGQLGASTAALGTQATDYHNSTLASLSGMQDALTAQMSALDDHLTAVNSGLLTELNSVDANVLASGQQNAGYYAALTQQLSQMGATIGQQQADAYGALSGQLTQIAQGQSNLTHATGTLLDWVNEIKARLQQGDYSKPMWGSSGQSWASASTPFVWPSAA